MNNQPEIIYSQIRDAKWGENTKVVKPVNIYECTIGDDCFIGPFVEIQKGVIIGDRTRIQSHSFVCELVTIGCECVVAHGVMFINDTFSIGEPAKNKKQLWQETTVGNYVYIGSNATILPVNICDKVIIGAGSVVTKNITTSGIYAGNPAKKIK